MRRSLTVAAFLLTLCGLGWLYAVTRSPLPAPEKPPAVASAPEVKKATKKAEKPAAFAGWVAGESRPVEFEMDDSARRRMTPREQGDQLRDWLLYTLVGQAGLTADEVSRTLFDVPAVRHGHVRQVANFEHGATRSCVLGDGVVLAVVPACGDAERADHLAGIADEHRKSLGQVPERLVVFEYALDVRSQTGALTRRDDVNGAALFLPEAGYHAVTLGVAPDAAFEEFMRKANCITHVSKKNGPLVLGGRAYKSRAYRGLRVEDVAAVWQAQSKLKEKKEEFDSGYQQAQVNLKNVWQAKLDALNREIKADPLARFGEDRDDRLRMLRDHEDLLGIRRERPPTYKERAAALQKGFDQESEALQKEWAKKYAEAKLLDHTGFSLDPDYDYEGLHAWFKEKGAKLLELGEVSGVDRIGAALAARNVIPLLEAIDRMRSGKGAGAFVASLVDVEHRRHRFQKSRYDGDLQGTEVGMVLFYTDLLAKLWTLDYQNTLPRSAVPDFRANTDGGNAALYRAETEKYSSTRIWFGPEERAYQMLPNKDGVAFAARATRIFSASSNPLRPGAEVPASYASGRVMDWWNDHYEEVARHEPEYERLNEYIKWSVIVAWMQSKDALGDLSFLSGVKVDRSAWFPDWVKTRPLRYTAWDKVGFHPKGYKRCDTEAMPILMSEAFADYGDADRNWTVAGGVGGARVSDIVARPGLPASIEGQSRLSMRGLDPKHTGVGPLRTVRGASYDFRSPGGAVAELKATAREGLPQRSRHGDLKPGEVHRTITSEGGGLKAETRAAGVVLGELSCEASGNGFKVGYRARALDAGQAVARDASRAADPKAAMAADARVGALIEGADGATYVKVAGGEGWLKVAPETAPSPTVAEGWQGRAGDPTPGSKTLQVAWVSHAEAMGQMPQTGLLRVERGPLTDRRDAIPVLARGPPTDPPGLKPAELRLGPDRVNALVDREGRLHLRAEDLPARLRSDPVELSRVLRELPAGPIAEGAIIALPGGPPPAQHPLVEARLKGDLREANRLLASDFAGGRKALEADAKVRCAEADRLLAQGLPGEALAVLREASRAHPDNPAVLFRRGLADLQLNRPAKAADGLAAEARRAGTPQRFLAEVNRLLEGANAPEAQGAVLRMGRETAARDLKARRKTDAQASLTPGAADPELHASIPGKPRAEPAKPADVKPGDRLYLDDGAGLNNRDFSASARQKTIDQAVSGGDVELVRLHGRPDPVYSARPDRVTYAGERTSYSEARGAAAAATASPVRTPHRTRLYYTPASAPPRDDEEEEEYWEQSDPEMGPPSPERRPARRAVFLLRKKVRP